MKEEIKSSLFDVIGKEWGSDKIKLNEIEINYPPNEFGDYSCNVAMKLAKKIKKDPFEIAEKIVEKLGNKNEKFEKIEVVKPGFINFYLSEKYLQELTLEINSLAGKYGNCELGKDKKILIDFVSANPTGPIHLGNGRGGPFGDSLGNILEKCGFKVSREYYVNDYGNQIKVLGHSVLKDEEAQYKGKYIDELNKENKLKDPFKTGQWAAHKILKEIIKPSMEKLGIKFDSYFSEKSLHDDGKIEKVFELLKNPLSPPSKNRETKGFTYEKDGALWFRASRFGDEKDRVIKKTGGDITYFGADIANHKDRFDGGFNRVIDIWGSDHHGDVKRVLGAMEALGYKNKVEIILTQFVRVLKDGKEYKMSKRAGTYISVDDLLEEVGKDAVRFLFSSYSNNTHVNFDVNLAKEKSDKNPVYYVQYAHARICSILGKKEELKKPLSPPFKKGEIKGFNKNMGLLKHKKELDLLKHLNKFPELVVDMAKTREVHHLPNYLIKLADKFHSFYNECKVLDEENKELTQTRLELVKATKIVLVEGLRLLGVSAPKKM